MGRLGSGIYRLKLSGIRRFVLACARDDAIIHPDDEESFLCSDSSKEEAGICLTLGEALLLYEVCEVLPPHTG
jgi:hypothetical protein